MKKWPERFLIAAVLAVFSYEWLISGFNKLLSGSYIADLHAEMLENLPNVEWPLYRSFLHSFGMAHCTVLAILVETAEICVGAAFVVLTVQVLRGQLGTRMIQLGIFSCAVAIFMNLNFLFYESGSIFLSIGDPFDEGVSIDFVMTLIECGLSLYLWNMMGSGSRRIHSHS
jgi:thiosulfate dehydrogenase (quinone) large subunit